MEQRNNPMVWVPMMALVLLSIGWMGIAISGCTLVYPCGAGDSEYCVGDDCVCGSECTTAEDCSGDDGCVAYEFEPGHGVCADSSFMAEHDLVSREADEYVSGSAPEACEDYCDSASDTGDVQCGLLSGLGGSEDECTDFCDDIGERESSTPQICLIALEEFYGCWSDDPCEDPEELDDDCRDAFDRVDNYCPDELVPEG